MKHTHWGNPPLPSKKKAKHQRQCAAIARQTLDMEKRNTELNMFVFLLF